MPESTHTPGPSPWEWASKRIEYHCVEASGLWDGDKEVLTLYNDHPGGLLVLLGEDCANQIEATPLLLAACEATERGDPNAAELRRAAIAKAKGERDA